MNETQIMIEMDKLARLRTNHILHLLLSIVFMGFWIPVWIIVSISNSIERGKIERKLNGIEEKEYLGY